MVRYILTLTADKQVWQWFCGSGSLYILILSQHYQEAILSQYISTAVDNRENSKWEQQLIVVEFTQVQTIQGTSLEYLHLMLLYNSTPLQLREILHFLLHIHLTATFYLSNKRILSKQMISFKKYHALWLIKLCNHSLYTVVESN